MHNLIRTIFILYILTFGINGYSKTEKILVWDKILSELLSFNESNSTVNDQLYTNTIDEDLLRINKDELVAVEKKWKLSKLNSSATDSKVLRIAKNNFFHKEIQNLNKYFLDSLDVNAKNRNQVIINHNKVAQLILDEINKHPFMDFKSNEESQIGFCFAYALKIHHLLKVAGVPQEDIIKIFEIGDFYINNIMWKFHVVMAVKDSEHGFIIIDPIEKKLLPYKEWFEKNKEYDIKKDLSRIRFYITDPTKFLPSSGAYTRDLVSNEIYKDFFKKFF